MYDEGKSKNLKSLQYNVYNGQLLCQPSKAFGCWMMQQHVIDSNQHIEKFLVLGLVITWLGVEQLHDHDWTCTAER